MVYFKFNLMPDKMQHLQFKKYNIVNSVWSIRLNKLENWPTQIRPNDKTIAALASGQLCTAVSVSTDLLNTVCIVLCEKSQITATIED